MTDKEIMTYINSHSYRQCTVEEAVYYAICMDGMTRKECIDYLNSVI